MKQQFPTPSQGLAWRWLAEVGRGYFNVGAIPEATRYLTRSVSVQENAQALELLWLLQLRRGRRASSDDAGTGAIGPPRRGAVRSAEQSVLRSATRSDDGRRARAAKRRRGHRDPQVESASVRAAPWRGKAAAGSDEPKQRSSADDSHTSLRSRAVAAGLPSGCRSLPSAEENNKNAGALYADSIAFLVQRESGSALDIYHRALSSQQLGEPLKVYCSCGCSTCRHARVKCPIRWRWRFFSRCKVESGIADLAAMAASCPKQN